MSNSTTNLDLISSSQAGKEITANSLFDAASPAMLYGRRAQTTAGLTWGYYGGAVSVSGTPTQITNGTVALTASATNYVEADPATGAVSVNTTGFTPGHTPLYTVVAGASTVTSYTDQRVLGGSASGTVKSVNTKTPDSSGAVTLSAADVGADASGAASTAVAAHVAASDPHTQYLTQARGDARYPLASSEGQANGIATLGNDGKLTASQLPDLAIIDFLGTVGSQSAMLALAGQKGDWCIRSDDGKVYTITGTDPTQAASWTPMSYPVGNGGTVTSVGLSTPGVLFNVAGSPVTGAGTLSLSLIAQAVNTVFAGPASGTSAAPTFRALVASDLPVMGASGTGHAAGIVPDPGATAGTTRFLCENGAWAVPTGTSTGGTPGGSTTQVQFNDAGAFGGSSSLTWDKTNNILYLGASNGTGTLSSLAGTGLNKSGNITIMPGANNGGGAGLLLLKGASAGTGGGQGSVTVQGGDAASGAAVGGTVTVQGGNSTVNGGQGGAVLVAAGDANSAGGKGGSLAIRGGQSYGVNSTVSALTITGGAADPNGQNGWAAQTGGAITITGGKGGGTSNQTVGAGGAVTIQGGDAGAVGTGATGNAGGNIILTPGAGTGAGARGNVVLNGAAAALATTATGGFTCIPTCAGAPTGTPANVPAGNVAMVFDTTNAKFWIFSGGAWRGVTLT